MEPIHHQPSALQVASRIRDLIATDQFPPGTPLKEVNLCKQLSVSRTPLREALKQLIAEVRILVSGKTENVCGMQGVLGGCSRSGCGGIWGGGSPLRKIQRPFLFFPSIALPMGHGMAWACLRASLRSARARSLVGSCQSCR